MIKIYERKPHQFNPKCEVAACYLEVEGDLLVLQRALHKSYPGFWGLPAGKLELNETPLQAVVRELSEETAIFLDPNQFRSLGCLYMCGEFDYVYHLFAVELKERPKVILSAESQSYRWVALDQVKNLQLLPGGLFALNRFKQIP